MRIIRLVGAKGLFSRAIEKANAYLVAVPSEENEVYDSAVSRNISSEIKPTSTVMWIMSIGTR